MWPYKKRAGLLFIHAHVCNSYFDESTLTSIIYLQIKKLVVLSLKEW